MGYLTFDVGAPFALFCLVGAMLRFSVIAGGVVR